MAGEVLVDTRWRDTARMVKVGPIDGRLMLFVILFMLFPGKKLFVILLCSFVFFYALQYFGYTLPNARRRIMVSISGKKRSGVHYWRRHKYR